jgi:hypothetical protein
MSRAKIACAGIALVVVCGAVAALAIQGNEPFHSLLSTSHHETAGTKSITATSHFTSPTPSSQTRDSSTTTTAGQSTPQTTGSCASVFTLAQAQTVLGKSATAESSNGVTSQNSDTTVITCEYSAQSLNATIVEHGANTSVGASSNDVLFGSGRPSGVTSEKGYGDAAFWQPSEATLNILSKNNWFTVSGASGTLSSAEQIALAAGL